MLREQHGEPFLPRALELGQRGSADFGRFVFRDLGRLEIEITKLLRLDERHRLRQRPHARRRRRRRRCRDVLDVGIAQLECDALLLRAGRGRRLRHHQR
jgi:hypothetical protein